MNWNSPPEGRVTAVRRVSVFGLAVLLAAATAAADVVITAEEVIACSVVWSDTNFTRLKLPNGSVRMLYTRDIRELRLADPGRVIEQAPQTPQVSPTQDSTRPIPPTPAPVDSLPCHASLIDTLNRGASPVAMAAKCREMDMALRERGHSNNTVLDLLREVNREQQALGGISPRWRKALCAAGGASPGGCIGFWGGEAIHPTEVYTPGCIGIGPGGGYPRDCVVETGGGPVGCLVGFVAGYVGGAAIDLAWSAVLVARHRDRVNDLVRRVNLAVVTAP